MTTDPHELLKADINRSVDLFLSPSIYCSRNLLCEGIESNKIKNFRFKTKPLKSHKDRSSEFKSYMGIEESTHIALLELDIDSSMENQKIIHAWKIFLDSTDLKAPLLIVTGEGSCIKELKYLAYDLKLGKRIAFIEQDIFPFRYDLYRLADVYLPKLYTNLSPRSNFPVALLEALECGVYPILFDCEIYKSLLPHSDLYLASLDQKILSKFFEKGFAKGHKRKGALDNSRQLMVDDSLEKIYQDDLTAEIVNCILRFENKRPNYSKIIENIRLLIDRNKYSEAMSNIDDLLENKTITNYHLSILFYLKGVCEKTMGSFENALSNYEKSLLYNPRNVENYLALGKMSMETKSYAEAAEFFSKVISLDDENFEAYIGLGLTSLHAGMLKEARFYIESAVTRGAKIRHTLPAIREILSGCNNQLVNTEFLNRVLDSSSYDRDFVLALDRLHEIHEYSFG